MLTIIGSSHREAPLTSADPLADDTDVWAFTPKGAPDQVAIAANWVPFEDPAGGPNFYRFDDKARYYINSLGVQAPSKDPRVLPLTRVDG